MTSGNLSPSRSPHQFLVAELCLLASPLFVTGVKAAPAPLSKQLPKQPESQPTVAYEFDLQEIISIPNYPAIAPPEPIPIKTLEPLQPIALQTLRRQTLSNLKPSPDLKRQLEPSFTERLPVLQPMILEMFRTADVAKIPTNTIKLKSN